MEVLISTPSESSVSSSTTSSLPDYTPTTPSSSSSSLSQTTPKHSGKQQNNRQRPQRQPNNKRPSIPNEDAFKRMSFLHQASNLLGVMNKPTLARHYAGVMKKISKRLVLRLDPSIKRGVCKSCDGVLIPGISSSNLVEISSGNLAMKITCKECSKNKRFIVRRGIKTKNTTT